MLGFRVLFFFVGPFLLRYIPRKSLKVQGLGFRGQVGT